jgi:hypothetical protein
MKTLLGDEDQRKLRENKVIGENEVVFRVGDLYVAEDIIRGTKRQVEVGKLLTENTNKRVLRG